MTAREWTRRLAAVEDEGREDGRAMAAGIAISVMAQVARIFERDGAHRWTVAKRREAMDAYRAGLVEGFDGYQEAA
jgi:hypothetical protein